MFSNYQSQAIIFCAGDICNQKTSAEKLYIASVDILYIWSAGKLQNSWEVNLSVSSARNWVFFIFRTKIVELSRKGPLFPNII